MEFSFRLIGEMDDSASVREACEEFIKSLRGKSVKIIESKLVCSSSHDLAKEK